MIPRARVAVSSADRAARAAAPLPTGVGLTAVISALLAAPPARPADETSPDHLLGDVIVTAQRRSENRQDVPASVQVLETQTLEALQVTGFDSYAKYLPSLSSQNWGSGREQLYIRGVTNGTDELKVGAQPSVAIYLDEQPVTTIWNNLDVHIYDIARIEELSGPQGTLYGSSAMSGTLKIITNKPDPTRFAAGYDLNANTVAGARGGQIEGFVNLPLGEHAAVRLVAFDEHDGGYISMVQGPTLVFPTSGGTLGNAELIHKHYNDTETAGGRAALRIELGDSWTVTPSLMAQQQDANGIPAFEPALGDLNLARYGPEWNQDRWSQAALTIAGRLSNFDLVYTGAYLNRVVDSRIDYSDYAADYDQAYVAYPQYWGDFFRNDAGQPIPPIQHTTSRDRFTKWSHELRITSPRERRLRAVGGVFIARQVDYDRAEFDVQGLGSAYSITGQPGVFGLNDMTRVDRDRAIFGELSFDVLKNLTLTGGLREFHYDNTVYGFFGHNALYVSGEVLCFPGSASYAGPGRPCIDVDARASRSGSTYKLELAYRFDAESMLYATWSTGFRPGGINRTHDVAPYRPDSLTNVEAGLKSEWFGHRLRFNAALFLENWRNPQYAICGTYCILEIINAGSAEIRGAELELRWVPVAGLTVSAAATVLRAALTSNACRYGNAGTFCDNASGVPDPSVAPVATDGTALPVARAKGNLIARYETSLGRFTAHGQMAFVAQSENYSTPPQNPQALTAGNPPGYGSVDLTAGLGRNHWEAEFYLTNALDNRGETLRARPCSAPTCTQLYVAPIQPRTAGIYFRERW